MKINLSRLTPDHVKEYRKIRLECLKIFPDNFGSTYLEEKANKKLDFEKYIMQQTPGKFIIGAFDEKRLAGICGFAGESQVKRKHRGSVVQMYIRNEYHGKGLGLQLLKAIIHAAFENSEIEQLVLSVVANNKAAIKIYTSAGFREYGFLKNYFKSGEIYFDQLFMVLDRKDNK